MDLKDLALYHVNSYRLFVWSNLLLIRSNSASPTTVQSLKISSKLFCYVYFKTFKHEHKTILTFDLTSYPVKINMKSFANGGKQKFIVSFN